MKKIVRSRPELIGKKLGMTTIFTKEGDARSVTVIELAENIVTDLMTEEKNGYTAVQVGSKTVKDKHLTKPQLGNLKKKNLPNLALLNEFRVIESELGKYKIGEKLDPEALLKPNETCDVIGKSIGKGFQGMVKLHNKSRGFRSHGSKSIRAPGSIGGHTFPGRVFPNKKMPARMGNKQVTAKNLLIVEYVKEDNLLLVQGPVPGPKDAFVVIKPSIAKWN